MSDPRNTERGPCQGPRAAKHKMIAPYNRGERTRSEPRTVFSTAVYPANTDRVLHTVVVEHEQCGQLHLHRTRSLAPFVRRAVCGLDRYRIVPVLADVEYGSDQPEAGDWADRDGRVYSGGDGPKLRSAS